MIRYYYYYYYYYYYIDTDEIPGFFLFLKNHIFIASRARGRFFSNFIHKMALLRYAFAVVEFFSSSLDFDFLEQKR